jgi:hypothetical protein
MLVQFSLASDSDSFPSTCRLEFYMTASQGFTFYQHKLVATIKNKRQTPWPESAIKLYRPSDRHLLARLVPTFADRGVSRSQRGGSPTAVNLVF